MSNLDQRIANLSTEKRALLERRLMGEDARDGGGLAIPKRIVQSPCSLSFAQERLWFLNQMEPESPVYNVAKGFRLEGVLDAEALKEALNAIVARHEVLRTSFAFVDGAPMQAIADTWSLELTTVDLRRWPKAERETRAQRLVEQQAQRPFDLSRDLMLRATLVRLAEETHLLLLVMHHIAFDGSSCRILFLELGELYEGFTTGSPGKLPELHIQYADFSQWQRQLLKDDALASQLSYWTGQLADNPTVLELPTDRSRPTTLTYHGGIQSLTLSGTLADGLETLSKQKDATLS